MTGQNIKINVDVNSNGTTERETKRAGALNAALETAVKTAGKIRTGGGTAGSRSVAAGAEPVMAAQVRDYGVMRGAAGQTGASARDFANQAQGLGGLVRLYATFAANVFAVSAAFRALSSAMDTTNMVRGLNQIGAASGQNLGSLSKRIAELSDGALSLRESMQVVASASSAGMSTKNIERLTLVAKNAGLALGRSMPEAIDRLSRGIIKLEPELLDELGIMTRIEPAVQDYARSLGKAASQLSQYERQQAFANAVLKEGEEKFGAIAGIATNPYDKLLASLKNTLQTGLEFVNKFLAPVISLLATSPTGLIAALTAVGVALAKQALPALGQFKAGLQAKSEQAAEVAQLKVNDALKARELLTANLLKGSEQLAEAQIKRLDTLEKIGKASKKFSSQELLANQLLKKDLRDITEADYKRARQEASTLAAEGKKAEARFTRQVINSLKEQTKQEDNILKIQKTAGEQVVKDINSRLTVIGLNKRIADAAEKDLFKKQITSTAAYNASLIGFSGAWKLASEQINAGGSALTAFEKAALKAKIGLVSIGGVLSTVGAALNAALGWIGLLITALGLLDSFFSKAERESAAFNNSINELNSSIDSTSRTLDLLAKKGGFATETIAGIFAMSNAIDDLSNKTQLAIDNADRLKLAMGRWDKIKNTVASLFGGGVDKNLAQSLSKSVESALNIADSSGLGKDFRNTIKGILKVDNLDTNSIVDALSGLSNAAKVELTAALAELNNRLKQSSNVLQNYKSSVDETTKAYQEFIQSTADTNPLFKLGTSLEKLGQSMLDILNKGPKEITAAMIDLAKSPEKGMLFGEKFITQLIDIRQEFLANQAAVSGLDSEINKLNKTIEKNQAIIKANAPGDRSIGMGTARLDTTPRQNQRAIEDAQQNLRELRNWSQKASEKNAQLTQKSTDLFISGMNTAFQEGSKLIEIGLGQASQKAALTISRAGLAGLTGEQRAKEEGRLALEDIQVKRNLIQTNIGLMLSQEKLTAVINEANALANLQNVKNDPKLSSNTTALELAEANLEAAKAFNAAISSSKPGNIQIQKLANPLANAILEGLARGVNQKLAPQFAALRLTAGEEQASELTTRINVIGAKAEDEKAVLALEQQRNQLIQARLGILNNISGITTKQTVLQEEAAQLEQLSNKRALESLDLNKQINQAYQTLFSAQKQNDKNREAAALKELEKLGGRMIEAERVNQQEKLNVSVQTTQKLIQIELDLLNKTVEIEKSRSDLRTIYNQNQLEVLSEELSSVEALGVVSQRYLNNERYLLDIRRAELDSSREIAKVRQDIFQKEEAARIRIEAISSKVNLDDTSPENLAAAQAARDAEQEITLELNRQRELGNNTILGLQSQLETRKTILDIQRQTKDQQAQYNELLENANFIAQQIGDSFGKVGKSVADLVTSFAQFSVNADKGQEALGKLTKQLEDAEGRMNPKEQAKLETDIAKQRAKNTAQELADGAKLAGAAKSLFKEKTGAYKVLAATEKVLHIASVAMKIKEMFMDKAVAASKVTSEATQTAATEAGFLARAGTYVREIFAKVYAQLGIFGTAVAAGIIAAIGLKAFGGGGGGGFVATADQQQKIQGTGQRYDSEGTLVETGGGVFGDPTAKNEGIARSIEIIKDNAVIGARYDNQALVYLEAIEKNTQDAAKSIYSIPGLRTGSMFGTQEGTQSRGGLAGLLGGKRSREIIDSGLQIIDASFEQLASGTAGAALQFYETVQTTTSNFLRSKTKTNTDTRQANDDIQEYFASIFTNAKDLFLEVGAGLGMQADEINTALRNLKYNLTEEQKLSLRNLKGQELVDELNAFTGNLLSSAAKAIFPVIVEQYQKFGESALETIVRVTDTNKKIEQQLYNIGFGRLSDQLAQAGADPKQVKLMSIEITEGLVILAGGLENFLDVTNDYMQNFMTEVERDALVKEETFGRLNKLLGETPALGIALDSLNLSFDQTKDNALDTREEFKALVDSLKNTGPEGAKLAYKLMEIGVEFKEFTKAIDETVSTLLEEIPNKIKDIEKQIARLQQPGYDAGNAFWQLADSMANMYQQLKDADKVTRENVESLIKLTDAQIALLTAQNARRAEEQIAALELEASTRGLKGFAQTVSSLAKRMRDLVSGLAGMNQANEDNLARVRASARILYDAAVAENALRAEQILLGISAQTASLGMSQLAKEIQGISNSVLSAAQQLADMGQLTDAAVGQLMNNAMAQIEFAQQQNENQAQTILSGFAQETANQGLSQLAQQIQGVRDKARSAIQQLAQLGQATEENVAYITSLAQSQANFIAAQNARQAQELVLAKNVELVTKNLGEFGQEVLGIAQQAKDTVKQLVDLGQATDENIAAVRAWQAAMIESARATRLAAQEQQYADIFAGDAAAGLAAKFRSLGFTLPGNVEQFKQLIDAIDTTTIAGVDLRGQLLNLGSEFTGLIEQTSSALRSAYDARVQELTGARDQFKDFSETLKDFKKSLLTGPLSPLTPQQQYETNRQEFLRISALAQTGDVKAIQQLQQASSSFLESSRGMFASSDLYTQDFALVTAALDNTTTFAELQVQIAENTLTEIKNVVGGLITLEDAVTNSDVVLTGVGSGLQKAINDFSQLTNSTNIDLSRWEATSANQRNALLEASYYVQNQINTGIDEVAAAAFAVDTSIGDVAAGIANMTTNVEQAIADLEVGIGKIVETQVVPGFADIDQAITEAANDEENPTIAALIDIRKQAEEMRQEAIDRESKRQEQQNHANWLAEQMVNELMWQRQQADNERIWREQQAAAATAATAAAAAAAAAEPVALNLYYMYDGTGAQGVGEAGQGFGSDGFFGGFGNDAGLTGMDGQAATGTNYLPRDMNLRVHKGERILPAADNTKLMHFLDQTAPEGSLATQIQQLQKTIQELQQTVAEGAVINAEATNRNTEVIAGTITDNRQMQQYVRKIQDRNTIV